MKKLEVLYANNCLHLREVPASIGSLTNLKRISFEGCKNLSELPDSIGKSTSLVELDLSRCASTKRLPDFHRDMHYCLEKLILDGTRINVLPGNLGFLKKLKALKVSFPSQEECGEIPDDVSNLSSMMELELSNIKRLPESLSALSCLHTFDLRYCKNPKALPKLPSSLVKLTAIAVISEQPLCFPNLKSLANLKEFILIGDIELKEGCLDHMRKLQVLQLIMVKTRSLPEDLSSFPRLKQLDIRECEELHHVPTLPLSLVNFTFLQCRSFEKLPDLSNLKQLSFIRISCPDIPKEIPGLEYLKLITTYDSDGDCRQLTVRYNSRRP